VYRQREGYQQQGGVSTAGRGINSGEGYRQRGGCIDRKAGVSTGRQAYRHRAGGQAYLEKTRASRGGVDMPTGAPGQVPA